MVIKERKGFKLKTNIPIYRAKKINSKKVMPDRCPECGGDELYEPNARFGHAPYCDDCGIDIEKIDSDEYVEGKLANYNHIIIDIEGWKAFSNKLFGVSILLQEIDHSTLVISFNNGKTWYTMDEVKNMIDFQEVVMEIQDENTK